MMCIPVASLQETWNTEITAGFMILKTSSSIYQGDLILTGDNIITIEGRFDINGSIIVKDNATLLLKNAFVNFTQTRNFQYNITLRNPSNGKPHLVVQNSVITSKYPVEVFLYENSNAIINNSTVTYNVYVEDYSVVSLSNSSIYNYIGIRDSSFASIYNCSLHLLVSYVSPHVQVYNSGIDSLFIGPRSINCTISDLKPGLVRYWNFITNSSVNILPGSYAPNVTLTNTKVNGWRFGFYGYSNATILNSTVDGASAYLSSSTLNLKSTVCGDSYVRGSSVLLAIDSAINSMTITDSASIWLLNTTYNNLNIYYSAEAYVGWHIDVHVIDSLGQDVPSVNVTATYPNATVAESKLTNENGWARLTLIEKMINDTGEYPIENYIITAKYETHTEQQPVNVTGNQEITIELSFIIPELPKFLLISLFVTATFLIVIIRKRKRIT